MTFSIVRQEASIRLQEANALLGELRTIASEGGVRTDNSFSIKKGMFFVLLYASFEYVINRVITETANQIHLTSIKNKHLDYRMIALALDPQFTSLSEAGKKVKWKKRQVFCEAQKSSDIAVIHDTALTKELGNIWCNTLEQVFYAFGLSESHIYDENDSHYIDEVVDNRNKVAHGRESAASVGQAYTVTMLEQRLNAIENQKEYVISRFETFVRDREFISSSAKRYYQ
jgi:hypothetical protein